MIGVIGKINIEYVVDDIEYKESIIIDEHAEHFLEGCPECRLMIDEVYYVVDTIYGVNVYFNDQEDDSYIISGCDVTEFNIEQYKINGTMKIVMF